MTLGARRSKGTLHPGEGGMGCRDWTPAKPLQLGCGNQQIAAMAADNVALEAPTRRKWQWGFNTGG